jgi:uncharacterized protein (TIGR00369 family)
MKLHENFEPLLRQRLEQLHTDGAGTIGDMLDLRLLEVDPEQGEILLRCGTASWMRNLAGTLHGGMCATVVDQAMGFIAYCLMPGAGIAPTVQLQVTYHRPLIPGEEVFVLVKVLSQTKSLMHLTAEAALVSVPDRVCLTATGTFFYKPSEA